MKIQINLKSLKIVQILRQLQYKKKKNKLDNETRDRIKNQKQIFYKLKLLQTPKV